MISIHSRVVHLSHFKEMNTIFFHDITISLNQRTSRWASHGNHLCQWNQCNNSCLLLTFFLAWWYQFTQFFFFDYNWHYITIFISQKASTWLPRSNQLCQRNQYNNSCLLLTLFLASWYQFTHVWSTSVISRRWAQFFPLQLTSMTSALRRYLTGIFCSY